MTDLKRWAASFHFLNPANTLTYICQFASEKQMHWILEANYPPRRESSSSQHLINIGIAIVHLTENESNKDIVYE